MHTFSCSMLSFMSLSYLRTFFIIISVSTIFHLVSPLEFNFSGFNESTVDDIPCQGDAFFSGQVIWLTKNDLTTGITRSIGRAVCREKLLLWESKNRNLTDFSTHFSFSINPINQPLTGDGLTFFLLSDSSIFSNTSVGGFLGLYTNDSVWNTSVYSFVAIEIDTYKNGWDSSPSDHLGINVNSYVSAASVSLNSSFKDGRIVNVSVSYNSSSKNLSVLLTCDVQQLASLWHVVDLREILPEKVDIGFSASTGNLIETHRILSWNYTSSLIMLNTPDAPGKHPIKLTEMMKRTGLIVESLLVVGVITAVFGVIWFIMQKKASRSVKQEDVNTDEATDEELENEGGPKRFNPGELTAATNNFAKEGKLGQGGFGEVYKGVMNHEEVAIKRVCAWSKQGKKEYTSEVRIISRLRHRNLVQLVGWCHRQGEFLLVYKFMPNGSLDSHLYSQEKFLAWPLRYKIALGLASALLYLHEEWEQCVVHRDIKPSNVMLDSHFEAKLGDFGLARLVDHEIGSRTTHLAGTMGYLAPEIIKTNKVRKESDVYSFGIVALEIACGRRPYEPGEELDRVILVEWVWELYGQSMILEGADKRLQKNFEENEMNQLMVIGLWCAHPNHNQRPSIRQAVSVLKFEAPLPLLPLSMPAPTFSEPPMDMCFIHQLRSKLVSEQNLQTSFCNHLPVSEIKQIEM